MSDTRAKLSKKNKYYIEENRYYELKYFCLQYPTWKKAYLALDGLSRRPADLEVFSNNHSSPTERCAISRQLYSDKMKIVEDACKETDSVMWRYILKAVTEEYSYDKLNASYQVPCCRNTYYKLYRKFFWVLDQKRE